ncbi:MAG: succinate dehydrogenase iron-sulfur subunit [Chloroflexota bacterium]|nr:succinate dehydrogenase iron-sulfur subunit [Chloroflexota bacterium]MEE2621098.1 succinate dehydrogenase iron-sulfur subunit [Chloroflexota bacterium]GIR91442.1 MAG: succinate dehydrogenase iron-sulfur subunit [Chloroflexota bacterium]
MEALIKVKRYNPEESEETYFQDYSIDVAEDSTILDSLIKIREEQDGTLSLRCSCRASICGSCSMRVNGSAKLVCKTRVKEISPDGEAITIEPMGNFKVIKDLVTEMDSFWSKMKSVDPYVKTSFEPEAEHIASNESMTHLLGVMNCIMCGACVSECTAMEVDPTFTGPAALAKAYRFVADPRDEEANSRLGKLNENTGVWDCTRCLACVEVCPKDVAPMERIVKMRDLAIEEGYTNTSGYRHTESFNDSIKKHGRLDETRLALESTGLLNISGLIDLAKIGIKSLIRGKLPPILPHRPKDMKKVTSIAERLDNQGKEEE